MARRPRPAARSRVAAGTSGSLAVAERPQAMAAAHAGASLSDRAMASWTPPAGSADADLIGELSILTPRSRDLVRNNGIAAAGIQTQKDNIVGHVLRLSAKPEYRLLGWEHRQSRAWGNLTEAQFRSWGDTTECDAGQSLNLLGLVLQSLGGALVNGDAVVLPVFVPRPGSPWALRLMSVEADRLGTPPHLAHRQDIRGGVEVDEYGAPVAYHFRNQHPGDRFGINGIVFATTGWDDWKRVPAFQYRSAPDGSVRATRRVIHLHDKERTGQSRGKPIITSVMREFHMAGKYATNELQASVANSLVAAFLESSLDQESAAALFGDDPRAAWSTSTSELHRELKAGAIIPLPAGAKLSSFTPGRPNAAFEAFMLATLRHIAAAMNMPYELLLKDFSRTNYSSARAALLEAWRYFHGRRRWIKDTLLQPIYELWLEEAVELGRLEAPGFWANRYAYSRCRFIFAGRGYVDPVKEATAAKLRMESGLSTLEDECAEQGLDWEEVLEQQAYEAQRRQELGLPSATLVQAVPAGVDADADADDAENEDESINGGGK